MYHFKVEAGEQWEELVLDMLKCRPSGLGRRRLDSRSPLSLRLHRRAGVGQLCKETRASPLAGRVSRRKMVSPVKLGPWDGRQAFPGQRATQS